MVHWFRICLVWQQTRIFHAWLTFHSGAIVLCYAISLHSITNGHIPFDLINEEISIIPIHSKVSVNCLRNCSSHRLSPSQFQLEIVRIESKSINSKASKADTVFTQKLCNIRIYIVLDCFRRLKWITIPYSPIFDMTLSAHANQFNPRCNVMCRFAYAYNNA